MLPLLFEFGTELAFPVSECTTAVVTIWAASAAGFIFTRIFSLVLGPRRAIGDTLVSWCIAIVFMLTGGRSILAMYPHGF
ncbi:hypothetical protein DQ04_03081070 [Trypanosoma grayi]|uniref:hypothetical protein n=1 Tax=Trypanosoma grayi TaxID=71804 RepID=UPI0004F4628F|nr:hypothetical protein DQ04_03081070 [Trypanosoma grayi]KEG10991.1 hypothetical protein DQ04_03081070 [Trypanosoma grayi]